jgi:hypothetical protein
LSFSLRASWLVLEIDVHAEVVEELGIRVVEFGETLAEIDQFLGESGDFALLFVRGNLRVLAFQLCDFFVFFPVQIL